MMKACPRCDELFLDEKHLADHLWLSPRCGELITTTLCEEHDGIIGISKAIGLEKTLHRAMLHNDSFPGLDVEFLMLQVRRRKFEKASILSFHGVLVSL